MTLGKPFKWAGLGLVTASSLLAAWAAGFLWFAMSMSTGLPAGTGASTGLPAGTGGTDAIVVLTGGSERLATGIQLLDAGLGRKLFVSGVHRGVDVGELMRAAHVGHPDLAPSIVLGYSADDTAGNAAETAAWIKDEHYASLRLVTAGYHMRRSLLEFRRAMPGIAIVPHPVFPDSVKQSEWWRWPGTAALLATEYTKYLAALGRHWVVTERQDL